MRVIVKDYRHWKFKLELMRFGILLLVVAVFWVGIELYTTYSSTTIPDDFTKQIDPLNPALDLEMMEELSRRTDAAEDFSVVINQTEEGTRRVVAPTPQPTPAATQIPLSSPLSTESGLLEEE